MGKLCELLDSTAIADVTVWYISKHI